MKTGVNRSNNNFEKQIEVVDNLLEDLGLERNNMIYVFNKIDKLTNEDLNIFNNKIKNLASENHESVVNVSAIKSLNIDLLVNKILNQAESGYNINSAKVYY